MNGTRVYQGLVLGVILVVAGAGCSRGSEKAPRDPQDFREYLLKTMPDTLEATTCQCCNKSLKKCYEETLEGSVGCPDT